MEITMEKTKLEEILEKAEMKGKYYDGNKSKNSALSNYAYCLVEENILFVYNADLTTACGFRSEVQTNDEQMTTFILDIAKTRAYLKPFDGEVRLLVGDFLTITDGDEIAKLPLVTEHPSHDMIRLISGRFLKVVDPIKDYNEEEDAVAPTISFGKTEYDCHVQISERVLSDAMKACDVVDLARYKIDATEEKVLVSSERSVTDSFVYEIGDCVLPDSEATMEFTGDILKFINGSKQIHMFLKDESPLVLVTDDSMLVKAPYLAR
jgi:hypothetical protein